MPLASVACVSLRKWMRQSRGFHEFSCPCNAMDLLEGRGAEDSLLFNMTWGIFFPASQKKRERRGRSGSLWLNDVFMNEGFYLVSAGTTTTLAPTSCLLLQ